MLSCALLLLSGAAPPLAGEKEPSIRATVERRELQREIPCFLALDYRTRFQIFAPQRGWLQSGALAVGKTYQSGEIVLELRNEELRETLLSRQDELAEAAMTLEKTRLGLGFGQTARRDVERAEARHSLAKARFQSAREAWESLRIAAPFTGWTVRFAPKLLSSANRNLTMVEKGDPLLEFVRMEPPVLRGIVRTGQPDIDPAGCRASVESNGSSIATKIMLCRLVEGDASRPDNSVFSYELVLELPCEKMRTRALGTSFPVILQLPPHEAARSVPRDFLLSEDGSPYCLVLRDGKPEKINVLAGERDALFVEIFGPLEPGDTVLLPSAGR